MTPRHFLLVSPGAVDGYPPVQYQAQLLAEAGHAVTLITMARCRGDFTAAFTCPKVEICCVTGPSAFGGRTPRMASFARLLFNARRSAPAGTIEIAYDPIGVLYSDIVPLRPRWRIAHLHELLQGLDGFLEKRLFRSLRLFDAVVVPDAERAIQTQASLDLPALPLVVENYPLRAIKPIAHSVPRRASRFEVVYCGSLGIDQKLDSVIRSIPSWPDNVDLVLIGNDATATARILRALVDELGLAGRVHFEGWMDTPDAERRMAQSNLGIALLNPLYEQWRTALGASNKRYQFMKAGLPQIGDMNPGVSGLLEGIGACVPSHAPEQIATLVTAYANNPKRCAVEGSIAFSRHQDLYNYERVFRRLQDRMAGW